MRSKTLFEFLFTMFDENIFYELQDKNNTQTRGNASRGVCLAL